MTYIILFYAQLVPNLCSFLQNLKTTYGSEVRFQKVVEIKTRLEHFEIG